MEYLQKARHLGFRLTAEQEEFLYEREKEELQMEMFRAADRIAGLLSW